MRALETRTDEAIAVVERVDDALADGERAGTFLTRTARRRLIIDRDGRKRLHFDDSALGGLVCLRRGDRELYVSVPEISPAEVPDMLSASRTLFHLGIPRPHRDPEPVHRGPLACDGPGWENAPARDDLEAVAAGAAGAVPVIDVLRSGLTGTQRLGEVWVCDVLTETLYMRSGSVPFWSRCRGVELRASVSDSLGGPAVALSRYAIGLDRIDLADFAGELAMSAAATGSAGTAFDGPEVIFTPTASAQLLRHIVDSVLLNPLRCAEPLRTAIVDDGRSVDGYCARVLDCEGTPTGLADLVSRCGEQHSMTTRMTALTGDQLTGDQRASDHAPIRLTGNARWDPVKDYPKLSATNVHLAAADGGSDLLRGERCVVVDTRGLGVEEHRSGGQLAFRLLAVATVDGVPRHGWLPFSVEGEAIDFLASLTAVGPTVSHYPGSFSAGGSYLAMNLSRLTSRR